MTKKILFVFCFLIAILIVKNAGAVGIISPGQNIVIDFKPGLEKTLTFGVRSNMATAMDVGLGIGGDLNEYITISDETIYLKSGETKYFTVAIKFPDKIDVVPGEHKIRISAIESPSGGGISARGAVSMHITIRVPYPGKYALVYFDAENVNANEPIDFKIRVDNLGTEDLKNVNGLIEVYDGFKSKLKTIDIEQTEVNAQSSKEIIKTMSTIEFKPGDYKAVATIYYFENKTIIEKEFKIGSLDVKLINYTKEFEKDFINRFDTEIKSGWNNEVPEIYAGISIKKEGKEIASLKTPTTGLGPWERKTISTYWDTNNIEAGEYDAEITLHYSGKTTSESGKIFVVEGKKSFLELPGFIRFNSSTILIIIILLLIVIDIVWLVKKRKAKKIKKK